MKTIKNKKSKAIERVPDDEAAQRVKSGWKYVPKKEWKALRAPIAEAA